MADVTKAMSEQTKADAKYKFAVGAVKKATQQTPVNTRILQQKLNSLTAAYDYLNGAHADYVSKAELAEDDDQGEAWLDRRRNEYDEVLGAGEAILGIAEAAEIPPAPTAVFELQEKESQLKSLCKKV